MDAIDGAEAAPPDELAGIPLDQWPYGGAGRPSQAWYDDCRARGINPRVMVYESYPTRSQGGFNAGVADCTGHEARAREVGHSGANAVAVSDGNGADAWDASQYGAGWASVATMPFFAYGAPGVISSFEQGAAGPLLIPGGWIPVTWGNGAVASQLVYEKAPISTPHDLNRVFYDFGQEADDMDATQAHQLETVYGILTGGGEPGPYPQLDQRVIAAVNKHIDDRIAAAAGDPVPLDISTVSTHDLAAELAKRV